jgi:hypothetical protein
MKYLLLIIQFIIFFLIAAGVIFLVFFKNDIITESFQNNMKLVTKYFEINQNYNELTKDEQPGYVPVIDETLLLDVGSSFGQFDASKMPWDTENRELTESETVWGIIPGDATIALFRKILLASQLRDINSLQSKENQYYYEDPLFQYGTDNPGLATGLQSVTAVTQFAVPLVFGILIGNDIEDALRSNMKGAIFDMKNTIAKNGGIKNTIVNSTSEALKKIDLKRFAKVKLNNVTAPIKKIGKGVSEGVSLFNKARKAGKVTKLAKTATVAGAKAALAGVKAASGFFKKVIINIVKNILARLFRLLTTLLIVAVAAGSWLDIVSPGVGAFFNFVITPLVLILSLPDGPITKALDKWADSEGTCPRGTTALDQIIPSWAMILISFIPIVGDILDMVYPYVCSVDGSGLLVTKGPYNLPKYMEYPWLSTYFWNWPEYNGRASRPQVQGKYLQTELDETMRFTKGGDMDLYNVIYNWNYGPYLNFDDIVRDGNTNRFNQVNKKLVGFRPEYEEQNFFPSNLPSGAKFFYADFSDPTMLVQMAQFYYDFSIKNPEIDENSNANIQIISKINYVIASTLYTCDVECEMLNIRYNPINGEKYSEYITLNHDRRFYFGVDYNANPPTYWENSSNTEWVTLDNRYDSAVYNLNEYLHRYDIFKPNDVITGELLVTAYEQIKIAETNLNNLISSSNYTLDDYNILNENKMNAQTNYVDLIEEIGKYETPIPAVARARLDYRVNAVIEIKNELWDLQKRLRPVSQANIHPQYKIYGCTHLDYTAGSAIDADVSSFEVDYRKHVNFNVLPYISRCKEIFLNTQICADISNVEQVITKYKEQFPNKDIKSIVNIKAQGKNVCKFTWDEVTTGQNDLVRKEYNLLYQTDLSSCTFCLPNRLIAEGSSELPAIESIKMYKNPITDSNEQIYNSEYNTRLQYRKAFYFQPTITSGLLGSNVTFSKIENIDTIPRFDPNTYAVLPELVRPKKPIRVTYPGRPQSYLGTNSNDLCSNPETLQKFILDYNATNPANKILSVVKAYTVDDNTCDLSVDILFKNSSNNNTVQRRTISFNVKPATEGFANVYTYDSINNNDALLIRPNTPYLEPPYSETGVTYGKPYLNRFNPTIQSNVTFFDNQLVTDYTKNTLGILRDTRNLLLELKDTQYLANDASNCRKKCDNKEIMQRIMEQYNIDNKGKGRYDQEDKTMYTIFKAATESADKCHLYFAQTTDNYGDRYAANKTNSSNYLTESRVALRAVNMKQLPGICNFVPIAGQTYVDISASDVALQSGVDVFANDSNFYVSDREIPNRDSCTNLNCRDANLVNAAINDYNQVTGNSITRVFKTLKVGNDTCDYSILQNLLYEGEVVPDVEGVLRVRYKYPIFKENMKNCGSFTYEPATVYDEENYKSDTFELQFSENISDDDPNVSPIFSYNNNPNDPINSVIQNIP